MSVHETRSIAIGLLQDVGTEASIPTLEESKADNSPVLQKAAEEAIDVIRKRSRKG
jgi:hypothetical protein